LIAAVVATAYCILPSLMWLSVTLG